MEYSPKIRWLTARSQSSHPLSSSRSSRLDSSDWIYRSRSRRVRINLKNRSQLNNYNYSWWPMHEPHAITRVNKFELQILNFEFKIGKLSNSLTVRTAPISRKGGFSRRACQCNETFVTKEPSQREYRLKKAGDFAIENSSKKISLVSLMNWQFASFKEGNWKWKWFQIQTNFDLLDSRSPNWIRKWNLQISIWTRSERPLADKAFEVLIYENYKFKFSKKREPFRTSRVSTRSP